jgi:uncharacterized membrane protein YozB (DUF420 family)
LTVQDLPHLNALLNSISAALILSGFMLVRRKRLAAHKACMLGAAAVSAAFLVSYLVYHGYVGHVAFQGSGSVKTIYLAILVTHIALAAVLPLMVPLTLWLGLRGRLERHRRLAKWTLPIWLYVSVTGIVVYVMLYFPR